MCVAIPGRVVAIQGREVELDVLGARRKASAVLVPEVQVGDYALTSAGVITQILEEDEALASLALFRELMALDPAEGDVS